MTTTSFTITQPTERWGEIALLDPQGYTQLQLLVMLDLLKIETKVSAYRITIYQIFQMKNDNGIFLSRPWGDCTDDAKKTNEKSQNDP